ncbi:hypothetical protein HMPREF9412_4384 [Paenibacillus sp. HGF5]|nr:hypothetical protein HMPREF9412_4384 [Paenibacillus sp. HGF5]
MGKLYRFRAAPIFQKSANRVVMMVCEKPISKRAGSLKL